MMPKFADDLIEPTPSRGLAVNILPTLPESSTVSNNHAIRDKREEEEKGATWQPLEKKAKLDNNLESEQAASDAAAEAQTLALREAELARVSLLLFDAKGKPLAGNAGYSRTEEVVVETDGYRITRTSDGTVRKDLIKKK